MVAFLMRRKKEWQEQPEFWELVHYAKELRKWPKDLKNKNWKERILYRKLINAIPEFTEFEIGSTETKIRVTHIHHMLLIEGLPMFKQPGQDYPLAFESKAIHAGFTVWLKSVFKEIKLLFRLFFKRNLSEEIIYFKNRSDIQLEMSLEELNKKFGVVINHNDQLAKVIYRYEKSPESSIKFCSGLEKRDPGLYDKSSMEELTYCLVRSGIVEMYTH